MNNNISQRQKFRTETYNLLGRAKAATFELMDAVLTVRNASCLADFSLSPLSRRKWSSIYESLQDCRPSRNQLMRLDLEQIPMNESEYIMMAIDQTAYSRLDSPTLKDRGDHHQPSSPGKTTIGQGYSTIAWIPEEKGSWALPVRHERITSYETPISKAVWQLKQVSKYSRKRILALLDSEYGNASYVNQTKNIEVDSLIRVRSNLCLWSDPEQYSGRGRPKKHGDQFKLNDTQTWWDESETVSVNDPKLGEIKIRKWDKLHFYKSPDLAMNLVLVERLHPSKKDSALKPLWLVWIGDKMPPLSTIYQQYLELAE
ncbi:MAG: hypothetical protein DWQ58_13610 [Microcystis aeruginosa TA09]|nr:MAG: hypothetical protein DWQ58_13610 [Microcystis aeruginosa TA09]